jgi:group I intron endonuclease
MKNVGIYKIDVGSSINLKSRKCNHFRKLKNNTHANIHLQNAYNKYGKSSFKWEILEYLDITENILDFKKRILSREQYWMDTLNVIDRKRGYNIQPTAGSPLGTKQSKESISKMLATKKANNYVVSKETREKISKSNKMFGGNQTKTKRVE